MNEQTVRALWTELKDEMYSAEYSRALALGPVDDEHIRSLAQRVVEAVDGMPAPSRTMLLRREYAQAFADAYAPIPASKTETSTPVLDGMPSFWNP